MRIRIVAFASASEAIGASESEIELPEGSSIADLRATLEARHPGLEDLWSRLAIAVDGQLTSAACELHEGAEVALLPPVSGGCGDGPVEVSESPVDGNALCRAVNGTGRGAVVLFLGVVRDHHDDRQVVSLSYTAYRRMAESVLTEIVSELEHEVADSRVAIHHRLGDLAPGTPSVGIAVASPRREAAYELNRRALERLKREVPVWKHEHYADGTSVWREEESLAPTSSEGPR